MPANGEFIGRDVDLERRFRALSPWLLRILTHRYRLAPTDAEDLAQESFIRLGRYSPTDRARHPRALLLRIAANLTADAGRRRSARHGDRHVAYDEVPVSMLPGAAQTGDPELLLDLKDAILSLPEPLRETFLLARFTPLSQAQIAARLGISTKTVEWRISRAVAICLKQLGR